jgi:DNA polymerase-1
MGRYRRLPDASIALKQDHRGRLLPANPSALGHAMRASINTPIQGSAADIVMMAMIKLWKSEVLRGLGWKLLLQIHDEVILEGPEVIQTHMCI